MLNNVVKSESVSDIESFIGFFLMKTVYISMSTKIYQLSCRCRLMLLRVTITSLYGKKKTGQQKLVKFV